MFETLNTAGYDLYQLPNHPDLWAIDPKHSDEYSGSLKQVVVYMIKKLGFDMDEIEEGINILADNVDKFHNCCHFGAYKTPMFTYKKESNYDRRAS
jgi:hypothetical protein